MNMSRENNSDTTKNPFERTVELWKENGYECLGLIGMGTFGHIYEVKNEEHERSVAMKVCLERNVFVGEKIIWPSMKNKHIVPLIASSHFRSIGTWVFFMPRYKTNLGSRVQELDFNNDINAFNRGKSYLTNVIHGLTYMHSNGICHADLKIDNILIDDNDVAAIADFGYSQKPLLYIERYVIFIPLYKKQNRNINKNLYSILKVLRVHLILIDFSLYNIFNYSAEFLIIKFLDRY